MIPGIERPKSKPLKQTKPKTESKPVGPVTGSIRESKPEPKPKLASVNKVAPKVVAPKPSAVKPVQASLIGSARQQTKISKQVIKPSVQGAVTTKTTQLTKPVSLQGSTTSKPVSGPATKPLIPASAPVKPVYKKVLAVKPSVANPEKTAITINAKVNVLAQNTCVLYFRFSYNYFNLKYLNKTQQLSFVQIKQLQFLVWTVECLDLV